MQDEIQFTLPVKHVSDTAWLVAGYRANETLRSDAKFRDPLAQVLIGEKGREILEKVPNNDFGEWMLVVRTCIMDQMIARLIEGGVTQVLNLAAGLDTRPYRLPLPLSLRWIEVDLPGVIEYKQTALAHETPKCQLDRIAVDLTSVETRQEFFAKVDKLSSETLVITEGLLNYLTPDDVTSLAENLASHPGFRWWMLDIISPDFFTSLKNVMGNDETSVEQTHFRFSRDISFFTELGWKSKEFRNFKAESDRIRRFPPGHSLSSTADSVGASSSGIALLENLA